MSTHNRILLYSLSLVFVNACGCSNKVLMPKITAAVPVIWIVALDTSVSVPEERFLVYRDHMIAETVLCRLKNHDHVHFLALDDYPEDEVIHTVIEGGLTNRVQPVLSLQQRISAGYEQQPAKKGTNLGGFLRYVKKTVDWISEERTKSGNKGPAPVFVVLVFTDGHPDGIQIDPVGDLSSVKLTLWFWGVDDENVRQELLAATDAIGVERSAVEVVPFGYWQPRAVSFLDWLDRPRDKTLLEALRTGEAKGVTF